MNYVWQKIAFLACLGFTALMAGANLAHMTATAKGAPVPFLGAEIPQRTIMAIGALCVDVVIIVAPFALQHRHMQRQHAKFFVVLSIWLACSLVSIRSVHDWLAEASAVNAAPTLAAERQFHDIQARLDTARGRLKSIQTTLLTTTDYDKRKILISEERKTREEIAALEPRFWQAQVVPFRTPDDMENWVRAVILWALSVGCWVGFLGDDTGVTAIPKDHHSRHRSVSPSGVAPVTPSGGYHERAEIVEKPSGDMFHMEHPHHERPQLAVVAGTDNHHEPPSGSDGSSLAQWKMLHLSEDAEGVLRPDEAWRSFVKEGYGGGYTKEKFYRELKTTMNGSWKRTNVGVVYKGIKLL